MACEWKAKTFGLNHKVICCKGNNNHENIAGLLEEREKYIVSPINILEEI